MRIVIVDDHPVVCKGLENILSMETGLELVAKAASYEDGLEAIERYKPDIAIIDLRMPGKGGLELIREARGRVSQCRFIILTSYISIIEIRQAIELNVDGYVLKEAFPDELISAIRRVGSGRKYYDAEIMESIMHSEENDPLRRLTGRELEIMAALAEGLNNQGIAKKLFISENTVKKHIGNLLDKLELNDRTQAAIYAYSHGLITQDPLKRSR